MDMRSLATMLALVIGAAAITPMAGCAPLPTAQTNACPPGVPWVPDGYGNGKFIPGHCQGEAAQ